MTFQELQKVNETVKTLNIKGKEYAIVNERVKAFRQLYPEGFINTTLISDEGGVCTMQTTVGYYDQEGKMRVLATGLAQEKEQSSFINKTSYIENCETSAIGRALGMLGIGIDTSIASAEEVNNAIANQLITTEQIKYIMTNCDSEQVKKLGEKYKVAEIKELTQQDADKIIKQLAKRLANENEFEMR